MSILKVLKILLKVILWALASIIILVSLSLAAIVWVLNPSQLTPLCEKYANEYLVDANVTIGKAELTIWKTFPYATVCIEDFSIISNQFKSLTPQQKATLPANADTLITARSLQASVNLLKISLGTFELRDIMLDSPMINAVIYNNSTANFNIIPPSSDDSPTEIPEITLNSFEIANSKGISYYNALDSTSAKIEIIAAQLSETSNKNYQFLFSGNSSASIGKDIIVPRFPLKINGLIDWSPNNPLAVALKKWDIAINNIPINLDVELNIEKDPTINKLEVAVGPVIYNSVLPFIPKSYSKFIDNVKTDITGSVKISLLRPYNLNGLSLPYLDLNLSIPQSYVKFANGKGLDKLIVDMDVNLKGNYLDSTVVTLNKFFVKGKSLDFSINGKVDKMLSNAHIIGTFKGNADIGKVISTLKIPLDFSITGNIDANATINARAKQMNAKYFHNMKIQGDINFHNLNFFRYKDSMHLYSRNIYFDFGTNSNVSNNGNKIKDITMASITTDTISFKANGLTLTLQNGTISGGLKGNPAEILDTTRLVPIGAQIKADRINIIDIDSTKIRIRGLECNASIKRLIDNPTLPIIDFDIKANRMAYSDSTTRMNLRNAQVKMNATRRVRKNTRLNAIADSLGLIYRELSRDSLLIIARKERRKNAPQNKIDIDNAIDLKADSGIQRLINKWNISGLLKAERGRLFTPFFPLRNTATNVDILFSTDSVIINNADFKTGQSLFTINGGLRNIRSTLLGRNRKPLSLSLNVESDTLNVNELIKAAYAGSSYSDNITARYSLGTAESEEDIDLLAKNATQNNDSILSAITIPQNIDAEINIKARNGLYADMVLRRARGTLLMRDGQLQLSNVRANTDRGSMAINALYSAPTKKNIRFAFDINMKNIDVNRFLEILPEVDSILPLLKSMDGIIQADIVATTDVDSTMNVIMPSLKAAIKLQGDSLVLLDSESFATIAKMLRFKNKKRNLIDNMTVELLIQDSQLEIFPFTFFMDRYKLGVMGHNDLALNLNYHISVLKSPIPFKFGLNITGNADNMKFRLGGAKFKEDYVAQLSKIVDTTRINLREQIGILFRRGAKAGLNSNLRFNNAGRSKRLMHGTDSLTHSDSLRLIKEGIIEAPIVKELTPKELKEAEKARKKAEKERQKQEKKNKNKDIKKEETTWIEPKKQK